MKRRREQSDAGEQAAGFVDTKHYNVIEETVLSALDSLGTNLSKADLREYFEGAVDRLPPERARAFVRRAMTHARATNLRSKVKSNLDALEASLLARIERNQSS